MLEQLVVLSNHNHIKKKIEDTNFQMLKWYSEQLATEPIF